MLRNCEVGISPYLSKGVHVLVSFPLLVAKEIFVSLLTLDCLCCLHICKRSAFSNMCIGLLKFLKNELIAFI